MRIASRDAVARTEADRSEAWVMPGFFIDQTSTLILLSRGFGGRAPEATKKAILHQHKSPHMKKKIEGMIKKYQKFVFNIEWHIKTNRPWGTDLEKFEKELEIYKRVVTELKEVIQ